MSPKLKRYFQFVLPLLILVILLVGLATWFWRILVCAVVVLFVWFMARRSAAGTSVENIGTKRGPSLTVLFSAPQGSSAWNSPWREQQRYSFAPPRSWGIRNSLPCSGYSPHQQQTVRRHTGGEADEVPFSMGWRKVTYQSSPPPERSRRALRPRRQPPAAPASGRSRRAARRSWTSGCCRSPGTHRIAVVSYFLHPAQRGSGLRSRSPSTLTPKISARCGSSPTSGQPSSRSHLLTAWALTPSCSATWRWVQPFSPAQPAGAGFRSSGPASFLTSLTGYLIFSVNASNAPLSFRRPSPAPSVSGGFLVDPAEFAS